jgi:outer membrane receptor protein involved in Fe transport
LSKTFGVELLYQPGQLDHFRTTGVKGTYTPEAAVRLLIKGTPLELRTDPSGAMMVIDPRAPHAAAVSALSEHSSLGPNGADSSESRSRLQLAQAAPRATAGASSVAGQPPNSQERSTAGTLQEVIVTAQKRSERLQDVPLSISAVSAADIAAKGVTSLEDLQYSIPGLSMAAFGPGQENIQIRGVSGILGRPTTGQYLDELSVSGDDANNTLHVSLLDMERIEVLRGPQATLYGEGSMGGTIRYITARPDLSGFSGFVETEGGKVTDGSASYLGTLVANVPLIADKVGLRLVGGYERDGGWIDNSFTGQSDVNGMKDTTFRAALRALPADRLEVSVLFVHQERQDNEISVSIVSTATVPTYDRDVYNLGVATLQYDFGAVSLVEAAGYIDHNTQAQFDFTPYLQPILVANLGVAPSDVSQIFNPETEWTQPLQAEFRCHRLAPQDST